MIEGRRDDGTLCGDVAPVKRGAASVAEHVGCDEARRRGAAAWRVCTGTGMSALKACVV